MGVRNVYQTFLLKQSSQRPPHFPHLLQVFKLEVLTFIAGAQLPLPLKKYSYRLSIHKSIVSRRVAVTFFPLVTWFPFLPAEKRSTE